MNEITTKNKNVSMMSSQKNYIENIGKGLESLIGSMDSYQAICGYNVLNAINNELAKNGLTHSSDGVDKASINNAIMFAVVYRLNYDNRELFVIVRNAKRKNADGREYYVKTIECRPQYRGTLKIIASYGRDVKKVYPEWIVREGDDFKYMIFKGVNIVPPEWTPKSQDGKVLRVVVPVEYKDGFIDYRIAERESVATNIKAQIKQSVMFDNSNKDRILTLIKDMTLDQLLKDPSVAPYVNETYKGLSCEEMIITKLVLNATKRVPIDFTNAFARELLEKTYDNADVYAKSHSNAAEEIIANNQSFIEMQEPIEDEVSTNNPALDNKEQPVNVPNERQARDLQDLFESEE